MYLPRKRARNAFFPLSAVTFFLSSTVRRTAGFVGNKWCFPRQISPDTSDKVPINGKEAVREGGGVASVPLSQERHAYTFHDRAFLNVEQNSTTTSFHHN